MTTPRRPSTSTSTPRSERYGTLDPRVAPALVPHDLGAIAPSTPALVDPPNHPVPQLLADARRLVRDLAHRLNEAQQLAPDRTDMGKRPAWAVLRSGQPLISSV
jgi:hypothetical protein